MTLAAIVDALSSKKGGSLLAPAILLLGAALAIGQNQLPAPAAAETPKADAAGTSTTGTQAAQKTATSEGLNAAQRKEVSERMRKYWADRKASST